MSNGSIGRLAEEVLNEVRAQSTVKLAEQQILKHASESPPAKTDVGQLLQKVARNLRSKSDDLTLGDVEDFFEEVARAN